MNPLFRLPDRRIATQSPLTGALAFRATTDAGAIPARLAPGEAARTFTGAEETAWRLDDAR